MGGIVVVWAGLAGAQEVSGDQYANSETGAPKVEIPTLEKKIDEQDAALRDRIEKISSVGRDLEETQTRADGARARVGELADQTRELERKIAAQKESYRESKARYEERARAAYQGRNLEGLGALIDGWLGSGRGVGGSLDVGVARVLTDGRRDLQAYEESRDRLRNLLRQISEKENAYEGAVEEEEATAEELRRQEAALDDSIAGLRAERERSAARLQELEAAERARILKSRAASGGGTTGRGYQLGVARDDIVARPVGPIPKKEYIKLYKESARKYGFGEDWYVLAAIGQVESNHGQNMGPSTAGAMGPMQFLPSTWAASGVDGNGDGKANIMDPRDAIPAAAGYLKEGGAPRDWYAALYSYNHADWYVKKVFAVAEGYRRLAKDETIPPYV
ncbi:transglycosylase SLT domain-containing protein [Rubrobacter tropicus]|uniref:Transglycosylase SLT domain-containing protein n=2 Tax=Rubrobacter tropicus TaxID=2653851 RepID=A0A6G8QFU8_9ACTN|nr:transglycosylase SLT domain-containing protein [Rubrobacter tropicus]